MWNTCLMWDILKTLISLSDPTWVFAETTTTLNSSWCQPETSATRKNAERLNNHVLKVFIVNMQDTNIFGNISIHQRLITWVVWLCELLTRVHPENNVWICVRFVSEALQGIEVDTTLALVRDIPREYCSTAKRMCMITLLTTCFNENNHTNHETNCSTESCNKESI